MEIYKTVGETSNTTTFLSFERAIEESLSISSRGKQPLGYQVTEQGIILMW